MSTPKIFYNNSTKKWNLILKSGLSGAICFGDCSGSSGGGSGGSNGSCTGSLPCGDTGVFGGNYKDSTNNAIDYITISTPSNATNFGDLTIERNNISATSNGTKNRGVFGGGSYRKDNKKFRLNTIDYITISIPSNAIDFGDLTIRRDVLSATSNGTNNRGVFGGGANTKGYFNTIDYITISIPSNAIDFGDLTITRIGLAATSNGTNDRGVFGGGWRWSKYFNTIDYITISTPSNATDFGDLTITRYSLAATSNGTNDRGVFGGGENDSSSSYFKTIEYITISTPSNATYFGDLTIERNNISATSNGTKNRGVFGGGWKKIFSVVNTIDYITISTPSNATDFGDLSFTRQVSATSNA